MHDLEEMPLEKYLIIRKAAELEEISRRKLLISDFNAAFSGNEEHLKNLDKLYVQCGGSLGNITWESTPNWEEKLAKYKR